MRYICLILTAALLGGCGKYNAVDTMSDAKPDSRDIGLCGGGVGIDNQVGLIIRKEAKKSGGELSASQRSKIQAVSGFVVGVHRQFHPVQVHPVICHLQRGAQ